ncbi:MAG: VOC family protein [Planctomycetota bacterium]
MPYLLETTLYTPNPATCARWYADVVGLRILREPDERSAALRIGADPQGLGRTSVLLLFNPEWSRRTGRGVPAHGAAGAGHVAFLVDDLDAWPDRLRAAGVEIEQEITWSKADGFRPGRSIYVRDPAGNSVEFIDADIWPA